MLLAVEWIAWTQSYKFGLNTPSSHRKKQDVGTRIIP